MSTERDRTAQLTWYQRRVKAMEELLVCYRVGRQPGERLLHELERTRAFIAPDGSWRAHTQPSTQETT